MRWGVWRGSHTSLCMCTVWVTEQTHQFWWFKLLLKLTYTQHFNTRKNKFIISLTNNENNNTILCCLEKEIHSLQKLFLFKEMITHKNTQLEAPYRFMCLCCLLTRAGHWPTFTGTYQIAYLHMLCMLTCYCFWSWLQFCFVTS